MHDAAVADGSALVGALIGSTSEKDDEQDWTKKGMTVGATIGIGAVPLSDRRAVELPAGTEIIIKPEGAVLIPFK